MADARYISTLKEHLAAYKSEVLGVQESGVWGAPPRPYSYILPSDHYELNIVAPFRESFWSEQRRRQWKLHEFFHDLSSSQALAFNLFWSLYPTIPVSKVATRRILEVPTDAVCDVDF